MKNGWKILIICILWCMIAFSVGMVVGKTVSDKTYEHEIEESKSVKPLILEVYENTNIDKIRVLTVYSGEELLFQFGGEINKELSEDGTEIIFTVPPMNDSCFDEEGNILEE